MHDRVSVFQTVYLGTERGLHVNSELLRFLACSSACWGVRCLHGLYLGMMHFGCEEASTEGELAD